MIRPVEKALFALTLVGLLALAVVLGVPVREDAPDVSDSTLPHLRGTPVVSTTVRTPATAPVRTADRSTVVSSTGIAHTTEVPAVRQDVAITTEAPVATDAASPAADHDRARVSEATVVMPSTAIPTPTEAPATTAGTGPRRCASVEELWEADGYPVEDPCTLAEIKRVFRWAWTGTDDQRRSAIRNSHLLEEVFAALDEFGLTHDAGLFRPDERGRYSIIFEDIRWHGGPDHDEAVIGVRYRFDHPDWPPTDQFLDTLVQIEGEWKLSYRRSYCVKVLFIMELIGNDIRCPRDPHPEINEDEAPGSTGRY